MSDDIVKALLESLSDEQKAKLVEGLVSSIDKGKSPEVKVQINDEEMVSSTIPPRRRINEDFTVINDDNLEKRKTPVKAKKNQWKDTGEDRDPDFDPNVFERMGKATRSRGKVKKQTVECHVCGRSFNVHPNMVYGEYIRCNRCTGR